MIKKQHKNSEVSWDENKEQGLFLITSNREKKAKGIIKKSIEGNLIAFIENTNYSNSYVNQKVASTLKSIFDDSWPKIIIQDAIDCLQGFIYTNITEANGLSIGDSHTISGSYRHYCIDGAPDCGGKTYQGPVSLVYKGSVIRVCAGIATEYAKFKIK
ncbi:protein of unknown function [Tenacibaculum sp. 190130A14a]|uniref:Uncharacterized protein n=1 Tax=Tenacibaculum polynesiense TaxID=3137857 RepID=A0ABP1EZE7_9FLAO